VTADASFLGRLLEASFLTGGLLGDGIGDLLSVETEPDPVRATRLAYNLLQGAGARASKTEFVACPAAGAPCSTCKAPRSASGRKPVILRESKSHHGLHCEWPGRDGRCRFWIRRRRPRQDQPVCRRDCVQYNLPQAEADDRLIELIKQRGRWQEPPALAV